MNTKTPTTGTVEITTFKLNPDISTVDFITVAEQMQNEFLKHRDGFVARTLTQSDDGFWTDIVYG